MAACLLAVKGSKENKLLSADNRFVTKLKRVALSTSPVLRYISASAGRHEVLSAQTPRQAMSAQDSEERLLLQSSSPAARGDRSRLLL